MCSIRYGSSGKASLCPVTVLQNHTTGKLFKTEYPSPSLPDLNLLDQHLKGWGLGRCVCVCVCPRLCARLFSLPLLFGGSGMQTELETTDLVVTREPDTGSTTLTVPRTSSDSNPGSDPTSPATLQIRLQVTTLFQKKKGFFSFWI